MSNHPSRARNHEYFFSLIAGDPTQACIGDEIDIAGVERHGLSVALRTENENTSFHVFNLNLDSALILLECACEMRGENNLEAEDFLPFDPDTKRIVFCAKSLSPSEGLRLLQEYMTL
ncbi:hypothetical protein HCU64_23725 [Methylobacterium sp. C25]|uniref:hypothetical protein n=1 Tax=Methylobacterium sp. C25 TaxID=2721622 RepID=UPI001F17EA35|nr:hypothetical protein [Methylobacterium sp. C25]MCE4226755.1 hypothetical protein [Methylobacterium sp. C25]